MIIGAGLAGLSAAVELVSAGLKVTVLEKRGILGGRASSFTDPVTGNPVDNGPHLFLRCFDHTLAFLKRIGNEDGLNFQKRFRMVFVDKERGQASLSCPPLPAPFHLFAGMLFLRNLSFRERLGLLKVGRALFSSRQRTDADLDRLTVEEWLSGQNQSERARNSFWYMISIAALNEQPDTASAMYFLKVLRAAFGEDGDRSAIGLSKVGLSELYTGYARAFVEARGGKVITNLPVEQLLVRDGWLEGAAMKDRSSFQGDAYVAAVPPYSLKEMLPGELWQREPYFSRMESIRTSPIVSINLWFDRPVTSHPFLGLINSRVHWLFNRDIIFGLPKRDRSYVSLVISAARHLVSMPNQELVTMAINEIKAALPEARGAKLLHSLIFRERNATVSPERGVYRPSPRTPLSNFFLAGDWTDTGLPPTIESAVISGQMCARSIMDA